MAANALVSTVYNYTYYVYTHKSCFLCNIKTCLCGHIACCIPKGSLKPVLPLHLLHLPSHLGHIPHLDYNTVGVHGNVLLSQFAHVVCYALQILHFSPFPPDVFCFCGAHLNVIVSFIIHVLYLMFDSVS